MDYHGYLEWDEYLRKDHDEMRFIDEQALNEILLDEE